MDNTIKSAFSAAHRGLDAAIECVSSVLTSVYGMLRYKGVHMLSDKQWLARFLEQDDTGSP